MNLAKEMKIRETSRRQSWHNGPDIKGTLVIKYNYYESSASTTASNVKLNKDCNGIGNSKTTTSR